MALIIPPAASFPVGSNVSYFDAPAWGAVLYKSTQSHPILCHELSAVPSSAVLNTLSEDHSCSPGFSAAAGDYAMIMVNVATCSTKTQAACLTANAGGYQEFDFQITNTMPGSSCGTATDSPCYIEAATTSQPTTLPNMVAVVLLWFVICGFMYWCIREIMK